MSNIILTLLLLISYLVPFPSYRSLLLKFWTLRFSDPLESLGTMFILGSLETA